MYRFNIPTISRGRMRLLAEFAEYAFDDLNRAAERPLAI